MQDEILEKEMRKKVTRKLEGMLEEFEYILQTTIGCLSSIQSVLHFLYLLEPDTQKAPQNEELSED